MKLWLGCGIALFGTTLTWVLSAQDIKTAGADAGRAHVAFAFERKGLPIPKYKLTVDEDGGGTYEGQEVQYASGAGMSTPMSPQEFKRPVTISRPTTERIFKLAKQLDYFKKTCASKAKNIADTGTKVLTYAGPDGSGSCTYNYSENKDVQALTDVFYGITETLNQGRQLDHLHRYDRLGLDAAITFLAQEVSDGHALEVGTIEASLRSIVADTAVMSRVRARAGALLSLVPANAAQ